MSLTRNEIIEILKSPVAQEGTSFSDTDNSLFTAATATARALFNSTVFQRGLIEFSSYCRKNCHYCGLRSSNTELLRYRLTHDEIMQAVDNAHALGMGTIVLQAGEDEDVNPHFVYTVVRAIKEKYNLAVTLSLGDHPDDVYRLWRDSGADRYLLKIETSDSDLYSLYRPGEHLYDRLNRIETLQRLGYETCSGIIIGLPGMTAETLTDDLLLLSSMGLDMIACGPFIPHPQTPLRHAEQGRLVESLRVTALLRLANPAANIPAISALDSLSIIKKNEGRVLALNAGANVIMPSITPDDVRSRYAIYPGKNDPACTGHAAVKQLQHQVQQAGFTLSSQAGSSMRRTFRAQPAI
ncbi:[FeFe] hydrogenase H-cluster radical SAM maturase HydE [Halodesulfovibrio spirochaetisodalis]|uniref:Biotin synthase n=1 Tax=Halodesulfovibrio spirochaetisodalis TaxID=1560234 RepID=A0A1B7XMU6_9BACT|nr:[FeFe] hydrogenase H-cluster radical SAM maturase HydE [Halodesulfovibrio spirochaetisodalis]OBQ56831.1 biotin synthase [Halodesulfovibrio spirochaetisodalis]